MPGTSQLVKPVSFWCGMPDPFSFFLGLVAALVPLFTIAGIIAAAHALMSVRTSQGTIAWVVALVALPYVALPFYVVFGRNRFGGYVDARRSGDGAPELRRFVSDVLSDVPQFCTPTPLLRAACILGEQPTTTGNEVELLADGDATFAAILKAIRSAQRSIAVQYFIFHDDEIGTEIRDALAEAAGRGVVVHVLLDSVGSRKLPTTFFNPVRDAGGQVARFVSSRNWILRLQINFRNHRKLLLADSLTFITGGHNVGDEYRAKQADPTSNEAPGPFARFGHWRDTSIQITGPIARSALVTFAEDWFWSTHTVPDKAFLPGETPLPATEGFPVTLVPTGPADPTESFTLLFHHLAASARERLWITSPYFVPDAGAVSALQAAALRGVDVRVLLPGMPDKWMPYLASFTYHKATVVENFSLYRYREGFLHQKVILLDDKLASVGSANLDNRSFRLNFELTPLVDSKEFAAEISTMLEADFAISDLVDPEDLAAKPLHFKIAARAARLCAPVL